MKKNEKSKITFDAIIVGAGPAGAQCARELSGMGSKVLLMERSERIGEPNFSTAGTPKETIKDFDLPLSVTRGIWSRVLMQANSYSHLWDYKRTKDTFSILKNSKNFW